MRGDPNTVAIMIMEMVAAPQSMDNVLCHRHLHEECPVVRDGTLKQMGRLFGNWQIGEDVVNVLVVLRESGSEIVHFGQIEAVSNVDGNVSISMLKSPAISTLQSEHPNSSF